jgi:hypothetical protein
MEVMSEFETKKLGRKTYIYDTTLIAMADKVAKEHNIDITNTRIEFALVVPMINRRTAGKCRLVYDEYSLLTEVNYLITFSYDLWEMLKPEQCELLMCHELMHIVKINDRKTRLFKRFGLARHTVEDFRYLIIKYGLDWIDYVKDTQTIIDELQKKKEVEKLKKKQEKEDVKKLCGFYPFPYDDSGPICGAGSDVLGSKQCTKEDERNCEWAKKSKELEKK